MYSIVLDHMCDRMRLYMQRELWNKLHYCMFCELYVRLWLWLHRVHRMLGQLSGMLRRMRCIMRHVMFRLR